MINHPTKIEKKSHRDEDPLVEEKLSIINNSNVEIIYCSKKFIFDRLEAKWNKLTIKNIKRPKLSWERGEKIKEIKINGSYRVSPQSLKFQHSGWGSPPLTPGWTPLCPSVCSPQGGWNIWGTKTGCSTSLTPLTREAQEQLRDW